MKYTVHVEGKNHAEIGAQLSEHAKAFLGTRAAATTAPTATGTTKGGKKTRAAVETEEEEEFDLGGQETEEEETEEEELDETEEEETEEETEEEEAPAPSPAKANLQSVIGAFAKYAAKHSRADAISVLKKFKVKSVKDLKANQWADALKALKK